MGRPLPVFMIFEDPSRRRWKVIVAVFILFCITGVGSLALFVMSIVMNPPLPSIERRESHKQIVLSTAQKIQQADIRAKEKEKSSRASSSSAHPRSRSAHGTPTRFLPIAPKEGNGYVTAFLVEGDPESVTSLHQHGGSIDVLFPDWFFLTHASCDVTDKTAEATRAFATKNAITILPRITNGDELGWHAEEIRRILNDPALETCVIDRIVALVQTQNDPGVNIDIEALKASDKNAYLDFLTELAATLHADHRVLTVDVTSGDAAYDMEAIGALADAVVLMNYDEHYMSAPPGPIASNDWFSSNVDDMIARVGTGKLLVGLGAYGYDWRVGSGKPADSLAFSETMGIADNENAQPAMDDQSGNMHFQYTDTANAMHDVWFLNSVTAWNEWQQIHTKGLLGVGLWRLGTEDPNVWLFLGKLAAPPEQLATVAPLGTVDTVSEGEIFQLRSLPKPGTLDLEFDRNGMIAYAAYEGIPSGYVLERVGRAIPAKTLLLTFDDGPDRVWTPQILSILQALHAPAAFFAVGQQAQTYPQLLSRIASDGYIVGNHSYLHPDFSQISPERIRLELNSTERLIESAFGRRSVLFRAPYNTDSTPRDAAELEPLREVARLGYVIVGANIDSQDWKRPGVDQIITNVEKGLQNSTNHIIVFHDAGGNRSQTVEALKRLIPSLRARGYQFSTIDAAIAIPRTSLMPSLQFPENILVFGMDMMTATLYWAWIIIRWVFLFTTLLAILRILFLGFLVVRSALHAQKPNSKAALPPVSVLIPAFNEGKTLQKTLHALLQSSHKDVEVVVINDGSTDDTAAVVGKIAESHKHVRLINKENAGKSAALNLGFREARHEIVVTIDADTIVLRDTIKTLVEPFADPRVDAVCGNVEVGNVHGVLTGFQALEYITTQNFDRRAFDELNCISVVPGATGAWRKQKVLALGGYTDDTLTEDADLTLTLLRAGGKIVYAPGARSRTEAPETIGSLAQQRFRWSFGTFQCLYKHRSGFFEGTLGWVALPNMFFFQILFPVLSPIGDAVFLLSILRGDLQAIAAGYVLFLFMDLCGSLLAFTLERRPKRLMWLVLIQRFFYRQFMYVITFRSIFAMLRGRKHGWNKLERKGTVRVEEQLSAA